MKNEEYRSIIQILKSSVDATEKYGIPALMNYQFHLIARIDDMTQVQMGSTSIWLEVFFNHTLMLNFLPIFLAFQQTIQYHMEDKNQKYGTEGVLAALQG